MIFFLDANIPMYAAGGEHPYKAPCLRIMAAAASGQLECVMMPSLASPGTTRWKWLDGFTHNGLMPRRNRRPNTLTLAPPIEGEGIGNRSHTHEG